MPKRKTPDPNEKPQRERFIEAAREVGVDESGEYFERVFKYIVPPKFRSSIKESRSPRRKVDKDEP